MNILHMPVTPYVSCAALRSADESPMSTTPRPNDAETSAAGSTAPPGATQSSTVSTQALLAQGIHELVAR